MNLAPPTSARKIVRRAFTLIELLVVLAITAILLTIILVPMVQGFNLTRAAQGSAEAQEKARQLSEKISREIGNAAAVRDPNGIGGTVFVRIPMPAAGELEDGTRYVPANAGQTIQLPLQFSKLDLIPPAEGDPGRGPNGGYFNPTIGREDPTLAAPKGQITLPLAPGTKLVRYFLALRDPFSRYNNPYDGLLMQRNGGRDNLYVLYRAEVEPVVTAGGAVAVNGQFFDVDPNGNGRTPLYDDPAFFLPNFDAAGVANTTDAKATRIRNWLRRSVVQTEVSRYDLVSAEVNQSTRLTKLVLRGGIYTPRLLPLLQFRPDRIANDPAEGQTAIRLGDESDAGLKLGPETFKTKFGAWSGGIVRLYPNDWDRTLAASALYSVAKEYTGAGVRRYGIFGLDATAAIDDTDPTTGTLLFDSTQYQNAKKIGRRYPFSEAVTQADITSGWLSIADPRVRPMFNPFTIDAEKGEVRTSFGIDEIGPTNTVGGNAVSSTTGVAPIFQLPSGPANSYTGANANVSYTPANDPVVPTTPTETFDNAKYGSVNARFNKLWLDAQALRNGVPGAFSERGIAHRFIDLRVTPTGDNIASPLDPRQGFTRARIVPGSEEVFGPDMTPGTNYGFEIRYRRTTREVPGQNEYRINYVDLQAPGYYTTPGDPTTFVEDYAALTGGVAGSATPPAAYDPTNLISAVIQPRFKAGYLVLCSEPNVPIPAQTLLRDPTVTPATYVATPTRIRVNYRFQMTDSRDVVAVDYDTRSLISVLLTIRNFAQTNLPNPPSVSLKATATARNILR